MSAENSKPVSEMFTVTKAEENPALVQKLIAECERRNEENPELVRIKKNTWVKK